MQARNYQKGSPVLEYVGELLNHEQAEKREAYYSSKGIRCCYQLKLSPDPEADVVDGTLYGNAGRYINSSCKPNPVCKKLLGEPYNLGEVSTCNTYETTTPDVLCFKRHYERRRTHLAV